MSRTRFSSERIESLRADEIFVFGSNRQGWHGGGAAAYARQRFGAGAFVAQRRLRAQGHAQQGGEPRRQRLVRNGTRRRV